ncbi:hypothetical protein C8Q78DRAFT_1076784 [Trametes maxima]|nr:hypothetical protein C8Q78DRAFT_1076784 [Trametes maxima]
MTQSSLDVLLDHPTRHFVFRMAVFVWGFAWLMMSVLIFVAGRIVPQMQAQPPPLVLKPRSPRVRSVPVSPTASPPKSIASDPDEAASCESSLVTGPAQPAAFHPLAAAPPPLSKGSPPKKRWSFSTHFFSGRSAPSPKSSLFSEGSSTLVGSPSPKPLFPELPVVGSTSPTSDPVYDQDAAGSSHSTPTGSPRQGRGMRLPGAKVFKSLTRRMSSKQKPDRGSSRGRSPRGSVELPPAREGSFEYEERLETSLPRRATTGEIPKQARPGHLVHERNLSLPGEVFTTSFVNPFKGKSRKPNAPSPIDLSDPPTPPPPPPKRPSGPRRVLTSFQLALTSSSTASARRPQGLTSRRSSMSSTSTAVSTFSAPSVLSLSSGSPRSVPRTQPYGAPYYAAMPGSGSGSGSGSAVGSGSGSTSSRSSSFENVRKPRRASSLSPPPRPETVEEEAGSGAEVEAEAEPDVVEAEVGEEGGRLSALGLKLGQLGHGRPPRRTQQRESRQRVAVSEGTIVPPSSLSPLSSR